MPRLSRRDAQIMYRSSDGRFNIALLGSPYVSWRDPYHLLLTIPWAGFLGIIVLFYLLANALFAIAYLLGGNGITNARPGSFTDAFFFSVQTMATIGYGVMAPATLYTHVLVTIESFIGLLGLSMSTGIMFTRFARPTAKVLFSQVAVVTKHEGVPTFMFRVANQRRTHILEAQMRVNLLLDETTAEGQFIRRIYDLKLTRDRTPAFSLSWSVMHPIDDDSPLQKLTPAMLAAGRATFLITLTGIDTTVSQTVHARHSFSDEQVLWNMKFVDIFTLTPNGNRLLDYRRFHEVEPPSR